MRRACRFLPETGKRWPSEDESVPLPQCLTQGEVMVVVHQGGEGRLEGVFAEIPGGTPGQVVIGEVAQVRHLLQPKIARMRHRLA